MNRAYIDWLETLPCYRKPQEVNVWMGEWAPLPEHVDLSRYEEIQACGVGLGRAQRDRRLGQKKTLESWLQGRLPFIRESLGSSVTRLPLDDRQK